MLSEFSEFPLPAEEIYPSEPLLVVSRLPEMHRCLTGSPKDGHPLAVRTSQPRPPEAPTINSPAKQNQRSQEHPRQRRMAKNEQKEQRMGSGHKKGKESKRRKQRARTSGLSSPLLLKSSCGFESAVGGNLYLFPQMLDAFSVLLALNPTPLLLT